MGRAGARVSVQSPYSASRHNANSRGVGADRVRITLNVQLR
jgi:hypothetical protein